MTDVCDRVPEFRHTDPGTPESTWQEWLSGIPTVHLSDLPTAGHVIVVAPHPDDESLGCGGTVASLSALGVAVDVVVCSDGGAAAHPDWMPPSSDLEELRRREVAAAVGRLSPGRAVGLHLLGLPDGHLESYRDRLEALLAPLIGSAALVISPWPEDGHPDHRAVGLAVRSVASSVPRLEYPIWAWHWAEPADLTVDAVRVPLSPSARDCRAAAVECHRSQVTGGDPVVGPAVRAHFERDAEVFFVAGATSAVLRRTDRSSRRFFDDLHRSSPSGDPWEFGSTPNEVARHEHLAALLDGEPSEFALEIGCSTGHLTRRLAGHTSMLLAVDTSSAAIDVARRTCNGVTGLELRVAHVPDELTERDRDVDLVVLSEVGYYFDEAGLAALLDDIARRSVRGARLLGAHWTGTSPDHVLDAATTHRLIDAHPGWERERSAPFGDHLVDLWRRR